MTSPLRILHVASFTGNIGDNANHGGFRPWFESRLGRPVEWTSREIREFYWKERRWDESFVAEANAHDLLVIGGGNYFELWVERSPTGTSIELPPALFAQIRVPVFFNALGVDPGQGTPASSLARFEAFLDRLLGSPQYLVSVRNDGALATLEKFFGPQRAGLVHRLPDAGFFFRPAAAASRGACRQVGINVASDMGEVRFARFTDGEAGFVRDFAGVVAQLGAEVPDLTFRFFPHIFRDLGIIARVIDALPDRLRRTRVSVAPYATGDAAADAAFGQYQTCDLVLAMRFHASVCPIGLGRETLGLGCYQQIPALYAELGQPGRCIDVGQPGFGPELVSKSLTALASPGTEATEALARVSAQRAAFEPELQRWLATNCVTA